jgi:predicted transcriptional regulator of viral defense system
MSQAERALSLFPTTGIMRARDLIAQGIAPETLRRLVRAGQIERVSRGSYRLATAETKAYHTLAAVSARVPQGIVCPLSALQFHELTTHVPFEVGWRSIRMPTSLSSRICRCVSCAFRAPH